MPDEVPVGGEITLDLTDKLNALAQSIAQVSADNAAALTALSKATSDSLAQLKQQVADLAASNFEVDLLDHDKTVVQRANFGFGKPLKIVLDK